MTLLAVSHAILATAAFALHVALAGAAPFAARLADAAADWPHTPPARIVADGVEDWRDLGRAGPGVRAPGPDAVVRVALGLALGATGAAWLLVPSFATGMATARLEDPVVAVLLLALGLVAALAMEAADGRSEPVRMLLAGQGTLVLLPLALFLACLACSLIGGPGGLDATILAGAGGDPAARALLVAGLALAAMVDLDLAARLGGALSGEARAQWRISVALRLLTWIDLVAAAAAPVLTTGALAGPLDWLAALLAWPVKAGALAILLGLARRRFGRASRLRAATTLLGTAALSGLLGCILLLIGAGLA